MYVWITVVSRVAVSAVVSSSAPSVAVSLDYSRDIRGSVCFYCFAGNLEARPAGFEPATRGLEVPGPRF